MRHFVCLSRRSFAVGVVACFLSQGSAPALAEGLSSGEWLGQAGLLSTRASTGILNFTRFKDEIYILNSEIRWTPKPGLNLPAVLVPSGFVTDLASVPRVFFALFRPDGAYAHAAVVHDYLYWQQSVSRAVADEIFREAMTDLGVSRLEREILFRAVATFGASSWKSNSTLRSAGERRILKVFPTDPNSNWADWKLRADVFAD